MARAELTWVPGSAPRWFIRAKTLTNRGTNRGWRRVTTLIETNALPLSQTETICCCSNDYLALLSAGDVLFRSPVYTTFVCNCVCLLPADKQYQRTNRCKNITSFAIFSQSIHWKQKDPKAAKHKIKVRKNL